MTHVSPEAQRLRRAVVDCIEVAPVIVGCSGGPDSLALVASAAWALPSVGHEVHVVIVDHGLQ
ncbi:MAG: tRNA(Ile)-lysidine synthetase, partial [Candidatus Nanopelagicales bacterium]